MSDNKKVFEIKTPNNFPKSAIIIPVILILLIVGLKTMIVTIDSGEIGVPILFGKVQEYTLKEGINVIIPFIKVVKYPTRVQEYTMSSAFAEGKVRGDDSITIKTKNGLNVGIDMTIWYYIDKAKAFTIYKEIAKNYNEIEPKILRPSTRTILRDVAVNFTVQDLYTEKREEFTSIIASQLKEIMGGKHLLLDRVLIRKIILPKSVEEAISIKMRTKQRSEEMEYKKQIAQKEAEIREIEAIGLSKAQGIINSTLTPNYIQFKAIEVYKELVNSKNTTFIVMPTSSKGSGIPLILNADTKNISK